VFPCEDHSEMRERIEKELSKLFYAETKRRPMISAFISEIS
jgi:mRNA degradation ribonuclease J1/J2